MDKTFTIVGISTQGKITKFRVANGDMAARVKVLERNQHTDINMVQLESPMTKAEAIEAYKVINPAAAEIRVPNEKEEKPAKATKTVVIKKRKGATADAAAELLKAVEDAGPVSADELIDAVDPGASGEVTA